MNMNEVVFGVLLQERVVSPLRYEIIWSFPGLKRFKPETVRRCLQKLAKDGLIHTVKGSGKYFVPAFMIQGGN